MLRPVGLDKQKKMKKKTKKGQKLNLKNHYPNVQGMIVKNGKIVKENILPKMERNMMEDLKMAKLQKEQLYIQEIQNMQVSLKTKNHMDKENLFFQMDRSIQEIGKI